MSEYVLGLDCVARPGVVAAVSEYLRAVGGRLLDWRQFTDRDAGRFLLRVHLRAPDHDLGRLRAGFGPVAQRYGITWQLHDLTIRPRMLILVSRQAHCLPGLLGGDLAVDVAGLVGDEPDLADLARAHGVPFRHLPASGDSEAELVGLTSELDADLLVLAGYGPGLSEGLCAKFDGRAIGTRPYHGYTSGVKVVGATAHYVTADPDAGPVIDHATAPVTAGHTPADLVAVGRELERATLARAVRWHVDRRVLLSGPRTVVFRHR